MGKLKIKQKKKVFIPYTNQHAHMFAQSIQNCQKELKEMELKVFDDGFEDGKNWSDVLNFVILFYVMHELHGWVGHETGSTDKEYLNKFDLEHYEVVGNIFDNKELLQEEH